MERRNYVCPTCRIGEKVKESEEPNLKGFIIQVAVLGIVLALGLLNQVISNSLLAFLLFFSVFTVTVGKLVKKVYEEAVIEGKLSIELLVVIASIGAFLIGEYAEGSIVPYLFNIAVFLENYAAERARREIGELLKKIPTRARVLKNGEEKVVDVENVNVGEIIRVRPGEKIPLDGVVIKGVATIDEAPLTGESIPVEKAVGDRVYAGTLCVNGALLVRVERKAGETLLAKVIKLVAQARKERSEIERFVEQFAKYYTPAVMLLAAAIAIIPPIIYGGPIQAWIYRALTLLVIACPCALAISIPVAMVSGLIGGARNGVLIKGGRHLEHVTKVNVVALDKTGTLTRGRLVLSKVVPLNKLPSSELLKIAGSLSQYSNHPVDGAIVEEAKRRNIKLLEADAFKLIPGKGIEGVIKGRRYLFGNLKFLTEHGIKVPSQAHKLQKEKSIVSAFLADDKSLLGAFILEDDIRSDAIHTIRELKKRGLRVVMLTGDRSEVAEVVAKKLDLDEYYAELLPDEKVQVVENLMQKHKRHVAMVGDGINDAPALARACVGVAIGAGTEVAIESGDIVLIDSNLSKLVYLFDLSKKTMNIVMQNVFASIAIKVTLALLTVLGLIDLWVAVLVGDMGLSLAVIANALKLANSYA